MRFVSSFKMIIILLLSISIRRRICYLNLNLTFWMWNILIEGLGTVDILLDYFSSVWRWFVCTVASCSCLIDITYWLWTYVLFSLIKRFHLFSILLHINILTLHGHCAGWSSTIFYQIIWRFWANTTFFHQFLWFGVFVHVVYSILSSVSLY